jgi:RNA polymerase sigma factor (sigma-70 family)
VHDEHLFRHEFGRLVTALTRIFGLQNVALAEDVVQDTFCRAVEVWKLRGVPENPSAWLMTSAKNRAIDLLRRERAARNLLPQLGGALASEWTLVPTVNEVFDVETIADDELRMIFSCCNPELSEPTQIAITLNVFCGFSANEIAAALLSKRAAIEKRIERGKKALAASEHLFDLTDDELPERLFAVQRVIYLMFNEGYHGASPKAAIRVELCHEAMRLGAVLLENALVATPSSYALCALMSYHAARLRARVNGSGELVSLFDQDRSRWDPALIAQGTRLLERAATGSDASEYHLEAAIAAVHCAAPSAQETDWSQIVWLYDLLLSIAPSPVVALNRAIALSYRDGPEKGIEEIRGIAESERLALYPFYSAALGELEMRSGNRDEARRQFEAAVALARNATERRFLQAKVATLDLTSALVVD